MMSRSGPARRPAVILLAEDDPGDQELTRRALEEGSISSELHVVEDGEQALDYLLRRGDYADPARSPRPDLFLLDLNMPRIDGGQVLHEMKFHPECAGIPTVVLTTSRQEEDIIRSYDLGVKSFITKPVEFDEFIRVVRLLGEYWLELVSLPDGEG